VRAVAGVALIKAGRFLLKMPATASGDFDTCIYCKATGCENGSAEHRADCPVVTGIHPVQLRDMWPGGPAKCEGCDTLLWPGDHYSCITLQDGPTPILQVACTGCALLAEVEAAT
jgi:hypothetical protein